VEIQPPQADHPLAWEDSQQDMYDAIRNIYRARNLSLNVATAVRFKRAMLKGLEEAEEIGCEPDKCAYTGTEMKATDADTMQTVRTASGHIHIGVDGFNEEQLRDVVKWLDVTEALPGLHVEWDHMRHNYPSRIIPSRRAYYGQAGRYRLKPYGVEWRTPSSIMWYNWMNGRADCLFGSIHCAIHLAEQGVTTVAVGGQGLVGRTVELINQEQRGKAVGAVQGEWRKLLAIQPQYAAAAQEANNEYGSNPTILNELLTA